MTYEEALEIVARRVLGDRAETGGDDWDAYPEIGEIDWRKIDEMASAIAPWPGREEYGEAYQLLADRAEAE